MPTLWTSTPGANTSTTEPKLLKDALASVVWLMAPTVMAPVADAGLSLAAFWFSLPAATTGTTPAARIALMAALTALERLPPRDMFITALPERPVALAFWAT
jgi:hypothetical protein